MQANLMTAQLEVLQHLGAIGLACHYQNLVLR